MGFTLQLLSNAASRLVYMALLGLLNQRDPSVATAHATLLANAHALSALFTLNAFQYYIARRTSDCEADVALCESQFKLIAGSMSGLLVVALAWSAATGQSAPVLCSTLIAALSLALPELVYTMATARDRFWRPLAFYGAQTVFYVGYGAALLLKQAPDVAVAAASLPTLLASLMLFTPLRTRQNPQALSQALRALAGTWRLRAGTLAASVPIIVTPPAMAYVMALHPDRAAQIPQMLLFSSFVGALAFVMGNVFQHHGRDLMPRLLDIQREGRHGTLAMLLAMVLVLSAVLTLPVEFVLTHLRSSFSHHWPGPWIFYAAVCATAAVVLQWYTALSMHHVRPRPVLASNVAYLLLACALCATTLDDGIHVFAALALCGLARSLLNIADFFLMGRLAWRT